MPKRELLQRYNELCDEKRMTIDGVYSNSNKDAIANAIACLECDDTTLDKYFVVVSLKYPNTAATIAKSDYHRHYLNRLYVYNTARMLLQ